MYYGKRQLILTALAALCAGLLLHRLYGWIPNLGTALVSLVRESVWEHTKIIFWPLLGAGLWLGRGRPGGLRPWLLADLAACGLMLALAWAYNILLGGEAAWVNIALYFGAVLFAFWLATRFDGPFDGVKWTVTVILAAVLAVLLGLFTLWPPESALFADLSAAGVWYELPC